MRRGPGGPGGGEAAPSGDRTGGDGPSRLTTVDWLDAVHRLFPKETIERLERDAVERYEIHEVVTDPAVLARIEPDATLLRAVLRTKHLMNPEVLALARRIVETVVRQLMEKLATEVRSSFHGTRTRRPSRIRNSRNFDFRATIRANLAHYRPDEKRLYIENPGSCPARGGTSSSGSSCCWSTSPGRCSGPSCTRPSPPRACGACRA